MNRVDKCYSFLIIIIANCYLISALSDSKVRQVRQARGSIRYQYNHPPDYQPIPVAIVYEEKNDRSVKQIELKASSTTTSSTTTLATPEPLLTSTKSKPITSTTPKPMSTSTAPKPMSTSTTPKPMARSTTPKPMSTSTTPKPMSTPTTPKPMSTSTTPKPMSTSTTPKPMSTSTTPKPMARSTTPKPMSTSTTPKPMSTSTTPKPMSTSTTPKPMSTSTTPKPTSTSTTPLPEITKAHVEITTWRPLSTQSQNEVRALKSKTIYAEKEIQIPVEVIYDVAFDEERTEDIVTKKKNKGEFSENNRIGKQRRLQKEYKDISSYRIAKKMSETTAVPATMASQTTKKEYKDISIETKTTPEFTTVAPKTMKKKSKVLKISSTTIVDPNEVKSEEGSKKMKGKRREKDPVVPILESENYVYAQNGAFHYSYEGGDGTKAFQKGETIDITDEKNGEKVSGGFSYTGKDGKDISLTYTADENGYRPVGAHLPTPPPIPVAIARALRYLATKPTEPPEEDATKPSKKE